MNKSHIYAWGRSLLGLMMVGVIVLSGCTQADSANEGEDLVQGEETAVSVLSLPALAPAELDGRALNVVATTGIIGDVVSQVGGDAIRLTTLIPPGQDPHAYKPGAQDLTAVNDADVIFVNGWDLEEALVDNLQSIAPDVPLVPVSANITPLTLNDDSRAANDTHDHAAVDPHVWFSVAAVQQWVTNIKTVLSQLDPTQAETYARNAAAYQAQLSELADDAAEKLGAIPPEKRFLVTNHDSLNYLAHEYDLTVLGTVIPGMSTLAEPSARDLTNLIAAMEAHDLCTIFAETTVNDTLAQTVAAELPDCDTVNVVPLYTGALGPAGGAADSYLGMFRANIDAIVNGLE